MAKRKTVSQRFGTAKRYAIHLVLKEVSRDEDGRRVGLSYAEILSRVRRVFPIITYNGPHKGKPIKMTIKQLREIAYTMQSEDRNLRLPVRPRSNRRRAAARLITATKKPRRVASGSASTG